MASTTADLIAETRQLLYGSRRDLRNKLNGAHNDTTTTFTFSYDLSSIRAGAKVSVGLEDAYVWEVNASAKTATVDRGEFGSTAASHADATVALVNPIFSDNEILRAINAELHALSSPANGLFQMKAVDITYSAAVQGYDLAGVDSDFIDIHSLSYKTPGPEKDWPRIDSFRVERSMSTSEFASGNALVVFEGADPGQAIRVRYKAAFDTLSTLSDSVATVTGAPASMHDLIAISAALHLLPGREVSRNFDEHQGDTRRAGEVPPGANTNSMRGLAVLRSQRIQEEAARLAKQYPTHLRV